MPPRATTVGAPISRLGYRREHGVGGAFQGGCGVTNGTRRPAVTVCILGEWVQEFERFAVDDGYLVVWIDKLPASIDEGAAVSLNYFGPRVGETAHTTASIAIIEEAHGGFHVAFKPENRSFLEAVAS